jgi:ribosomal 50S subunit-associated protein YjgA (DUF615 family)
MSNRLTFFLRCRFTLFVVLIGTTTEGLYSQDSDEPKVDRVELRQGITDSTKINVWNPLQVMTLQGDIQSFDAKSLVIKVSSPDGKESLKTLSSEQVQAVEPYWRVDGAATAVSQFKKHNYADFGKELRKLKKAELDKIPPWEQVLLTGMVVQAHEANSLIAEAGQDFIALAKSSPLPELVYADMPLCWAVTQVDVNAEAKKWIAQEDEAAQLLGASWLLLGTDAGQAKSVLDRLKKSKTSAIAQLAKVQAWRLIPANETMNHLPNWLAERDRMLRPLALGPTEFIFDRLMRVGEYDLAIGQALQIATLYSDRYPKARRAVAMAAEMLKKQGRTVESEKVLGWLKQLDGAN